MPVTKKVTGFSLSNHFIWNVLFRGDESVNYLRDLKKESKAHYKLHTYDKVNAEKLDYL